MENKITTTGNETISYQEFNNNKDFFKIRISSNEDIIIEYIDIYKLDKLYKIKLKKYQLQFQFDTINIINTLDIYQNIVSSFSSNNFEVTENEDQNTINIKLKLYDKDYLFELNEKKNCSYIMQIINNNKEKEISNLKMEKKQLENRNNVIMEKYKELLNIYGILNNENFELKTKIEELNENYKALENENIELKKKNL